MLPRLTSDEINLLDLILQFSSTAQIAKDLNDSPDQIYEKIQNVLELFQCKSKTELIIKCGRESLHFINPDGIREQRIYFIGNGTDSH